MFKKDSGPRDVNFLWVAAGGYLVYLSYKLVMAQLRGEGTNIFLTILFVTIFTTVGILVMLREWKLYRHGPQSDDPMPPVSSETDEDPDEISEDETFEDSEDTPDV